MNLNEISEVPDLPVIHMVESDDYRSHLLIRHFNSADERGRRLMLKLAESVASFAGRNSDAGS